MNAELRRTSISCPHCGEPVNIGIALVTDGLEDISGELKKSPTKDDRIKEKREAFMATLLEEDKELIELAERTGVIEAFLSAWKSALPAAPNVPAREFLSFLHHMRPWNLAAKDMSVTALAIRSEFGNKKVAIYSWNAIAAIVVEDILSLFAPVNIIKRPQMASQSMKVRDIGFNMQRLSEWVKTRNGYVPAGGGVFFHEMQKRSPGAFANLGNL